MNCMFSAGCSGLVLVSRYVVVGIVSKPPWVQVYKKGLIKAGQGPPGSLLSRQNIRYALAGTRTQGPRTNHTLLRSVLSEDLMLSFFRPLLQ